MKYAVCNIIVVNKFVCFEKTVNRKIKKKLIPKDQGRTWLVRVTGSGGGQMGGMTLKDDEPKHSTKE